MENKDKLLSALERLQAGDIIDKTLGICANLDRHMGLNLFDMEAYYFVQDASPSWSDYSGNVLYPIPLKAASPWQGKAGELRMSLVQHLIKYRRQELGFDAPEINKGL